MGEITKRTMRRLLGATLLVAAAGSATAQECPDYAGTTRWVGEKAFDGLWGSSPFGRYLANDGALVVACDPGGDLTTFDVSRPDDLRIIGGLHPQWYGGWLTGLALGGSFVYLAQTPDSQAVETLADPAVPVRIGAWALLPDDARLACRDAWLYAVGGTTLRVIDVTDPTAPALAAELALPAAAVDLAVSESLVVVATEDGLLTIDVADPRLPRLRGICSDAGPYGEAVALQGPYAYLANHDLVIIDLSDPDAPRCVGRAVGGGGLAIAVENGWAVTTGTTGSGVRTLDVSAPTQPRLIGRTGPWMLQHCGVVLREGYAFTNANDMNIFLPNPALVAYRLGSAAPPPVAIVDPWPDSNGDDVFTYHANVEGGFLRCLTAGWVNGIGTVRRVAVVDPDAAGDAALVGSVEVHGGLIGWMGLRACVVGSALELLDLSDPAQPRVTATLPLPPAAVEEVIQVLVCDPLVLIVSWDPEVGVVAVDTSDPQAPFIAASGPSPLAGKRTVVRGGLGYAWECSGALSVLDLGDPLQATIVATFGSMASTDGATPVIANEHLWCVGTSMLGDSELRGYSLADPLAPALVSSVRSPAGGTWLASAGDLLLVGDRRGAFALDVSDPGGPFCAGMLFDLPPSSLAAWGERALILCDGTVASTPLPCSTVVPVFLASFAAAAGEGGVGISWTVGGAAAGEFRLTAGGGGQTWTVPFAVASDLFSARDDAPLLAAGGAVEYTLEYRASAAEPWRELARQGVELAAPARPVAFLAPHPNPFNPVVRIPF
ncbi:MAG: hypothetical protein ACYDIE_12265, partial [Candidatus Krumholzibacteriia bacterium]